MFPLNTYSIISPETIKGSTLIDTQDAYNLYQQGIKFIDVRRESHWDIGRIPEAIHLDLEQISSLQVLTDSIAKDEQIVVYCNSGFAASLLTKKAIELGYSNVYFYRDGFLAWFYNGHPVE